VRINGEKSEDDHVSLGCSVNVTRPGNLGGSSVGGSGSVCDSLGGHIGAVDRCRGVWDGFLGDNFALLR
jgi:hypothetical protein